MDNFQSAFTGAFAGESLPHPGTSLRLRMLHTPLGFSMRLSFERLILYQITKSAAYFIGNLVIRAVRRHLRSVFAKNRSEVQKLRDYRKSDYAINKYSPNIVYRFHDEIIEVALEDYLKENPDKTEQDFAELKALSDEIYYEQDRAESAQTRKDVSIHGLEETEHCATRALDEEWEERVVDIQNRKYAWKALEQLFTVGALTEVQKRRFRLHVFQGLSTRQIGRMEGTSHQAVAKSINLAIAKLKKYFAAQGRHPCGFRTIGERHSFECSSFTCTLTTAYSFISNIPPFQLEELKPIQGPRHDIRT